MNLDKIHFTCGDAVNGFNNVTGIKTRFSGRPAWNRGNDQGIPKSRRFREDNTDARRFQRIVVLIKSDIFGSEVTAIRIDILNQSTNGTIHGVLEGWFVDIVVLDPA